MSILQNRVSLLPGTWQEIAGPLEGVHDKLNRGVHDNVDIPRRGVSRDTRKGRADRESYSQRASRELYTALLSEGIRILNQAQVSDAELEALLLQSIYDTHDVVSDYEVATGRASKTWLTDENAVRIADNAARAARQYWRPEWMTDHIEKSRRGGQKSKRPKVWTVADLERVEGEFLESRGRLPSKVETANLLKCKTTKVANLRRERNAL